MPFAFPPESVFAFAGIRTICANLDYRLLDNTTGLKSGRGRTANLSSGGVLFQSEHAFEPGILLALAVAWPARINDRVGLTLHIVGRVVRVEGTWAAVATSSYEFRTRSLRSPAYESRAEDRQRAGCTIATMPSPGLPARLR